jgi:phosphoribosylglycinamide formyltransferase-1
VASRRSDAVTERRPIALGVLASGTGTNFEAIANAIVEGRLDATVRVVICNRSSASVIAKAEKRGIPTELILARDHASREAFDAAVATVLASRGVELVVMAGFDRLVTSALLTRFPQRVINIHPALLPAFKGLDAQRQAVEYGARISGATVHLVDDEMDHGPIVAQVAVPIACGDDEAAVRHRILAQEHALYSTAIQWFAEGRIEVRERKVYVRGEAPLAEHATLTSPTLGDERGR